MTAPARARWLGGALALALLLVLAVVTGLPDGFRSGDGADGASGGGVLAAGSPARADAERFLDTYVEDGRVVRTDQGGDTVSEGQAYALLLAVAVGDEHVFGEVWRWTEENLQRPDGLLSWRWVDGAVVDESSASDADLDTARALALAADAFDDAGLGTEATRLGTAILDHETVTTSDGLVLVAGQWATSWPAAFNPSYVSPVAVSVLAERSDDPRWAELRRGSRAALRAVTSDGGLPPDWASVQADGSVVPSPGPSGEPVRFGYDAARVLVRQAESCDDADRSIATASGEAIADDDPMAAVYDLAGSPQTSDASPLADVAQAATLAADGQDGRAESALAQGRRTSDETPTYYGDAWAALGPVLLAHDVLGGCPPLKEDG